MTSTTASTTASPLDSIVTAALVEGQPQKIGEAKKVLQTCEQLKEAGFLESKVYSVDVNSDTDSILRQRFCDQTTSGGGWTVPRDSSSNRLFLSGMIVIACLLFN